MPRRPHVASPDEVKITREGNDAIIEYADPKIGTTHFTLGRERMAQLSDAEILEIWNEGLSASEEHRAEYEYVAVEVPLGKPQVRYFDKGDQWVPRGDVIRAVVMTTPEDYDDPCITIDDRDYSPREFMAMLGTFGGWGMRIEFVPDDELHERPELVVQEPEEK